MKTPTLSKMAMLPVVLMLLGRGVAVVPALETPVESMPVSKPELQFTHLGLAEGLSHADVRSIVRDHQGFMWFGTWLDGVNRYDGYSFKVYKHDSRDGHSLSFDNVSVVYEDRLHTLWVGTQGGGLDGYDRETDSFIHYRHRPGDAGSLPDDGVRALYEDGAGTFWVGTGNGLGRLDRDTGTFHTYRHNPNDPTSLGDYRVRSICRDRETGMLWVGTRWRGVSVLDPETGTFTRFSNVPGDPTSLSGNTVNQIYQDRAGDLWFCTDGGLSRWNSKTKGFVRYCFSTDDPNSLCNDYVTAVHEDRAVRFWVGTGDGLDLFDRPNGVFLHYRHDPNNPTSLSDNRVNRNAIYEDDTGAVWIGTADGGVNRLAGQPAKFETYRNNSGKVNSLLQNTVSALYGDQTGNLWIGTAEGLDCFDGQNFVHYTNDPDNPNSICSSAIWAIAESPDHQLWIGTSGAGLCRFDGTNFFRYRHDSANPLSLGNDTIYGLQPDQKGGLWIAVNGAGVDYFDGHGFIHFRPDKNNPDSLSDAYVDSLFVDQDDCVWMGSATMGLLQLNPATRKATTYLLDPKRPGSKVANWVRDICSDGETIWVGAYSGLYRFDLATRKFTHAYTEQDGMANSSVVAVQLDRDGNVWASTVTDLSCLDVRHGTFRNYDAADGLQSLGFFERSRAQMADGRLAFGGVNGFNLFDPGKMVDNPVPPPVVLTDFQLFNKPVSIGENSPLQKAIHVAGRILLLYDQDVFRLKFAALNYTAPTKNRYAYRLEGFDGDWRYSDADDRSATYTRLSPGEYLFRVKASNNDGVWNEQGASVRIAVIPPWWQTWWARSSAAIVIIALAIGGYRWRVNSIERRSRKLEQQVAERTTELAAANKELEAFAYSVSHDLRAPLRAISGFSSILIRRDQGNLSEEGRHYLDNITKASNRMEQLIRDLLNYSRLGRTHVLRKPVALDDIFGPLSVEFSERIEKTGGTLTIEDHLPTVMGDPTLLSQIFTNLLENAFTYQRPDIPPYVSVTAQAEANAAILCVRDNGIGIPPRHFEKIFNIFQRLHGQDEYPGTGIGLATVKKSVEMLGGQLWLESTEGKGSAFFIKLERE